MIVRFRNDKLSDERGFDRRGGRAAFTRPPLGRGGLAAVLYDRDHLSEPYTFVWLDEGPGRERAGALEPVFDLEDALRCPLEVLVDYPAFIRMAFAEYNVSFCNSDVETATSAWEARTRWRRQIHVSLIETEFSVPRGQEWRSEVECRARHIEPLRTLNNIRRTQSTTGRRRDADAVLLPWQSEQAPESRPSVPIEDLFEYDRFYLRYVQTTKRFFVYDPAETAESEYAATSAWRRYVHELLTAEG